jgi:predicted DNA-binding transcriptional regulator
MKHRTVTGWIVVALYGGQCSLTEKDLENELKGTTFRVYCYILTANRPVYMREVQRSLELSSPSVAVYHLDKLVDLGLIKKDASGQYVLLEEVKVGLLHLFIKRGPYLIPRYLLYVAYFAGLLAIYFILFYDTLGIKDIYIIVLGASAIIVSIYELMALRKMRPL